MSNELNTITTTILLSKPNHQSSVRRKKEVLRRKEHKQQDNNNPKGETATFVKKLLYIIMMNHTLFRSLFGLCSLVTVALGFQLQPNHLPSLISNTDCQQGGYQHYYHHYQRNQQLHQSRDWIDEVDFDQDENYTGPPIPPDMKYLPRHVMRQNKNFVAIRQAGGKELTNDVYIQDPKNTEVFWFVGKVARVSDVTLEEAISRQWSLIETHGANLRPFELFPARGSLELWTAPGDSEMQVAYNDPDLVFQKMERNVDGAESIKNSFVGFQGEMYERGEEGFRTLRNQDGRAANPPIQTPDVPSDPQQDQALVDEDMKKIEEMLQGQDINALYEEQQRRAGKPIDD